MNSYRSDKDRKFGIRQLAALLGSLAIGMSISLSAVAAEWTFQPNVRTAGDYNDNANMSSRTDEEEEISGFIVEGSADIGYESAATKFTISPKLRSRYYPNDDDFDSDDQFVKLRYEKNVRSGSFGLRGDFEREDIRTAELADTDLGEEDPDDIADDDTGRVGASNRRIKWTATPFWTYRASNISSFYTELKYRDVSYDDTLATRLVDYTDARLTSSYFRTLSDRNTGILTATVRQYDADEIDNDVIGYGLSAGFSRDLTETTRFRALFGLENTQRETGSDDLAYTGDVTYTQRLETIRLIAQYRRRVSGTGSGALTARDEVNLGFTRDLSELLSAGLGIRAYQTNALDQNVEFNERDYVQLRSQFSWRLTRTFSVQADYRYTLIDRSDEQESANSNRVTLWLTYKPNPISRSR